MTKIIGEALLNIPWQDAIDDSPIWRYTGNPVINRRPVENVTRIFNSAVVEFNGSFVGVFRGETNSGVPYLYFGKSKDGLHFEFNTESIKFFDKNGEEYKFEYAYDPRVVKVENEYFIIWCDGLKGAPLIGLGRTTDFVHFEYIGHPFLPFNRNGVLFPRKINGEYVLLSRPSDSGHTKFGDIYLSRSKDLEYWGKHELVMQAGYEWWQSLKIGAGCVPIETDEGWLIIYHGATMTCSGYVYSMGGAILDKDNPSVVKYRCTNFLLTPEESYETQGFVPNVVFPVSALCDSDSGKIAIYYGGADTVVGLAFTEVNRLVNYIKKNAR